MADGLREFQVDTAIRHTGMIGDLFSGGFNPEFANPYKRYYENEIEKTDEEKELEAKAAWNALENSMYFMAGKIPPKK